MIEERSFHALVSWGLREVISNVFEEDVPLCVKYTSYVSSSISSLGCVGGSHLILTLVVVKGSTSTVTNPGTPSVE